VEPGSALKPPEQAADRLAKISGAVRTILECIGEDPSREGLLGMPEQYANAMLFFTKGYQENVRDIVNDVEWRRQVQQQLRVVFLVV
jgi:GTP cyclohydrolase I